MENKQSGMIRHEVFFVVIFVISIGANLIAVFSANWILPLLYSTTELALARRMNSEPFIIFANIMNFVIPTAIILVYIFPVGWTLKKIKEGTEFSENFPSSRVRRRVIQMPLALGLMGMLGWILGLMFNFMFTCFNKEYIDFFVKNIKYPVFIFLLGILCLIIVFYSLELLNRRYIIPRIFPENELSRWRGILSLSIRNHFIILFLAITVFPVFLLYLLFFSGHIEINLDGFLDQIGIVILIVITLSLFLTYMVTRYFENPIDKLARGTEEIKKGNLDISIPVRSTDELGTLSEGLNRMALSLKEKELIKDTLGKMVDPKVRDHLLEQGIALGGTEALVTVLFSDIRSFTALSERMTPERIVELLNSYFERMSRCIYEENGYINKFIGDAVLAVFGYPLENPGHADSAFRSARAMLHELDRLNEDLASRGFPSLEIGIGIHTGTVLAGNIGTSSRMEFTVIGDTVNVASRLETLSKKNPYRVFISEDTKNFLSNATGDFVSLGKTEIRGKEKRIEIFGVNQ